MSRGGRGPRRWSAAAVALAGLAVSGCADAPSALDPRGPAAGAIAVVWWVMLALATVVFLITTAFLLVAAFRPAPIRGPRALVGADERFITVWGIVVPAVILTGVLGMTIWSGAETYWPEEEPQRTVEVVGHQFWWEVRYPDADGTVVTANEIHVPTGEPVRLVLETDDVIHSFWVPQLHGKMDLMPGQSNEFWLEADEPGEYRGICAEYCGIQHAQMHFIVVALERGEFDAWLAEQEDGPPDAAAAGVAAGAEVFVEANCIGCHAVRGLAEPGDVGPDLTTFASRRTIGAGMLDNTRENLRAWILDPHAQKPGVRMPATPLPDEDLEALLDYLESLE
jgi:cytochrome c oxidase subunit 2